MKNEKIKNNNIPDIFLIFDFIFILSLISPIFVLF